MSLVSKRTHGTMISPGAAGTGRIVAQGTVDTNLANIETGTGAEIDVDTGRQVVRERDMMQRRKSQPPS